MSNGGMEPNGNGRTVIGGEMRRLHIIYFLSRMGRIEHPHLVRVHHLSRNGVHLKDVKRWLAELRGKDMPDSFSWSYKRRYKMGYVWQDLLDDDLITPISDNEFVLKGSEISSFEPCLCGGKKKDSKLEKEKTSCISIESVVKPAETKTNEGDSGPLDSETSTATDGSIRSEKEARSTEIEEIEICLEPEDDEEREKKKESKEEEEEEENSSAAFVKGSSSRSGATNVLRNLLNCRVVDTNDSGMMMMMKNKSRQSTTEICQVGTSFSGPERCGGPWNFQPQQQQNTRSSSSGEASDSRKKSSASEPHQSGRYNQNKKVLAAFKPVSEPHCSQCGKGFKPEKLHSHMKSCKGLRGLSKNARHSTSADVGCFAAFAANEKTYTSAATKETDVNHNFTTR